MALASVLIVGGGPAGLVTAIAMRRRGIQVEIVELEESFKPAGIGVNLQNSPLRALDTLGLLDEIEAQGYPTEVVNMLTADGRPMMPPLRPETLVPGRPSSIGISRGVLASILADAAASDEIPTRFNLTVDALEEVGTAVAVTFSDGTTGTYDLVVGADGINSRVRTIVMGDDAPLPEYSGQSIWRASAARGDVDEYKLLNGPVSKVGLVPISSDRIYLYALETFASEPNRRDFGDPDEALQRTLAPFGGDVPEVARRLDPGAELRALKILMLDDPWYRGHVLMIGDAAHASTPHISYGMGMAIEDGVVLAELVEQHGGDIDAVLPAFMKRRFARCKLVVENSRQLGAWEQHPPADRSVYGALMAESLVELAQPA